MDLYTHMPMLGVLIALLVALAASLTVLHWGRGLLAVLDPAARLGISGLVGLGAIGTVTYFVGLVSIGAGAVIYAAAGISGIFALASVVRSRQVSISLPKGVELLFLLAIGLGLLMALAGVLAPSTPNDWDSLAYHLAVPKLWLEAGKVYEIPFIHQSNFPFAVDSLFLFGLKWGGQAGAKAFVWVITLLGAMTIFGLGRQRYGERAGWWSALAFSTVPIVLWQSGTAYIDVAHGLYAGLGLVFACWWLESDDSKHAWLSAILLGFAAGTKYTGLQTIAIAGIVVLVGALLLKRNLKPVFVIGLVSLVLASPWYVKNALWKQNPVFPFFYGKLGGKDWDARRAEIYTREQNTFGVGRESPPDGALQPQRVGHSIVGLAYQPGRFVNPFQTQGQGDPMGAIGIAITGALMLGLVAVQRGRFERAMLACVLISLAIWFALTQQSRYIVTLAVPLALIAGQLTTRRGIGPLMSGAAIVQAAVSIYLLHALRFSDQMEVVAGKVTREEFQGRRIGFYAPAQSINRLGSSAKVALYDEVFGYLLDVPYYWANPGHGTMIPYDLMEDGAQYSNAMAKAGFTHVYVNLSPGVKDQKLANEMIGALNGVPLSTDTTKALRDNWEQKFNFLIADAAVKKRLETVQFFGSPENPRAALLRIR